MKYEEWIKYEELRRQNSGTQSWILLEPDLLKEPLPVTPPTKESEKPRLLSAILQVFNPRSI
jgi:hypothetical protein